VQVSNDPGAQTMPVTPELSAFSEELHWNS